MQSVFITTDSVSANLDQGEVYNTVIKCVSDLRQLGGFLRVLRFLQQLNWLPRYNWNSWVNLGAPEW